MANGLTARAGRDGRRSDRTIDLSTIQNRPISSRIQGT